MTMRQSFSSVAAGFASRSALSFVEAESLHGLNQIAYLTGQYDKCIEWSEQRLALLRCPGQRG